jgi:hypothetical protein
LNSYEFSYECDEFGLESNVTYGYRKRSKCENEKKRSE